jgi:hypothetical protein
MFKRQGDQIAQFFWPIRQQLFTMASYFLIIILFFFKKGSPGWLANPVFFDTFYFSHSVTLPLSRNGSPTLGSLLKITVAPF